MKGRENASFVLFTREMQALNSNDYMKNENKITHLTIKICFDRSLFM